MTSWKSALRRECRKRAHSTLRRGVSSIDYVLILGVILPLVAACIALSRQILGLAFEFLCVLVTWPFM